jgi:hypothetical protein
MEYFMRYAGDERIIDGAHWEGFFIGFEILDWKRLQARK